MRNFRYCSINIAFLAFEEEASETSIRSNNEKYRFHLKTMPKLTRCARFESCLSTQLGPLLRFLQLQTSTRKKKRDGGEVLQKVNRDRERQTQRKKRSGWKSTRLLRRDENNKSSHPHRFRVFYRSCCLSPSNHSQTRGLKRYRIRENSIRRKIRPNIASSRTTSSV